MNVELDDDIKDLLEKGHSNKYKKLSKDQKFKEALVSVYNRFIAVDSVEDLRLFSSLHYEKLKANLSGYSSVRIMNGRVERLIFQECEGGIRVVWLEINETHYGSKK